MVIRAPDGAIRDDITIPAGAAWSRTWNITDYYGNPLTVTGWRVRSQIRYTPNDPVIFEWNSLGGVGMGAASASGTSATISLTGPTDSALWTFTRATYDVYLFDPAGVPSRIVEGTVTLIPAITH